MKVPSKKCTSFGPEALTPLKLWWNEDTVAVVTGGNKGIGLEVCKQLAENGLMVVLTARDEKRGQDAVEALVKQGLHNIQFHPLDVQDDKSNASLASWLLREHKGLDILNALDSKATWTRFLEGARGLCWNLQDAPSPAILMGFYARVQFLPAHYIVTWEEAFLTGFFEYDSQIFGPINKDLGSRFVAYQAMERKNPLLDMVCTA